MNNIKVSIIIPVYNAEKYLRRSLDSVIGQTLTEIEIIAVNDASPDESAAILAEYAAKYSRIKIINHEKNQGQGASRDTGIAAASGEYIGFVDSDDWIEPKMYEAMYNKAVVSDADMVVCGIYHVSQSKFWTRKRRYLTYKIGHPQSGKSLIPRFFINPGDSRVTDEIPFVGPYEWNKIIRREIIVDNGLKHLPGRMLGEDAPFVLANLFYSRKVVCISDVCYNYFRSNVSAMTVSKSVDLLLSGLKSRVEMRRFLLEKKYFTPEIANRFYNFIIMQLYFSFMLMVGGLPVKAAITACRAIGNELRTLELHEQLDGYRNLRNGMMFDVIAAAEANDVDAFHKCVKQIRFSALKFKYVPGWAAKIKNWLLHF